MFQRFRDLKKVEKHWYRELRTTSASLADHQWSAEQTLGITGLISPDLVKNFSCTKSIVILHGPLQRRLAERLVRAGLVAVQKYGV